MVFAQKVKDKLNEILKWMASHSLLFSKHPGKDFSRTRKLDFETTIRLLLSMESGSIKKELLKYFRYDVNVPSASAFIQQRNKLIPEALEFLFHEFNACFPCEKTYHGYRLLACDGSAIKIPYNPKDRSTFYHSKNDGKGYNQLHLNALFDLCNKQYTDAVIHPLLEMGELSALIQMVDRYTGDPNTIFIADRCFESYNLFAHVEQKAMFYLIRVKDRTSSGMLRSFQLPDSDEFDIDKDLVITKRHTKEVRANPKMFKTLDKKAPFDFVDLVHNQFYPLHFRVLRFKISDNTYECIITNLPGNRFPLSEIKKIYSMRWGIEISFRELKYTIALEYFHSIKVEHILQEMFARLLLYNYCELIAMHVFVHQKHTKHIYQINFTIAICICKHFLCNDIAPPDVELLILKHLLPVRSGRSAPRKISSKSAISFLYRFA